MARNLNLIYVNIIYEQHFQQMNLHDMSWSIVENPTLPRKHSCTVKLTAVDSQWLLKSVSKVTPWCSLHYNFTVAKLV
jgi:hypothetical protein